MVRPWLAQIGSVQRLNCHDYHFSFFTQSWKSQLPKKKKGGFPPSSVQDQREAYSTMIVYLESSTFWPLHFQQQVRD